MSLFHEAAAMAGFAVGLSKPKHDQTGGQCKGPSYMVDNLETSSISQHSPRSRRFWLVILQS
jgi:hypothetical protein